MNSLNFYRDISALTSYAQEIPLGEGDARYKDRVAASKWKCKNLEKIYAPDGEPFSLLISKIIREAGKGIDLCDWSGGDLSYVTKRVEEWGFKTNRWPDMIQILWFTCSERA